MNILGLIGSGRALGNTELLVTEIAKSATDGSPQHSVRLLRLTDLRLEYCSGCMRCAMEEAGPCPLDDDMEFLLSEYRAADALILGAPAYTLLPPGPLKLIADRLIMYLARSEWLPPKPAITVGVAGLPQWSELLVPMLNCTVLSQGFYLVDSFLAYGAGPGEVLLDSGNIDKARAAGRRLQRALAGEQIRLSPTAGCCPVCGADFFRITEDGVQCPLCLARGKFEQGKPVFDPTPPNRWQAAALKSHFEEWIRETGPAYIERRPAIRPLLRPYRQRPFPLIAPQRSGTE